MGLLDASRAKDQDLFQFRKADAVSSVTDRLRCRATGDSQGIADELRIRISRQWQATAFNLEFQATSLGRRASLFDQSIRVLARHRPKVDRADAFRGRNVDCAMMVVDADVPTDPRRIEFCILPGGIGQRFVMHPLHVRQERDHCQVGVDAASSAGMSGFATRDRAKAVNPLVSINHVQFRRLTDDRPGLAGDHFTIKRRRFRDTARTVKPHFLVGGADDVERRMKLHIL